MIKTRIRNKRDTLNNWTAKNPILLSGEIAIADDEENIKLKIGDGVTPYNSLPFYVGNYNDLKDKPTGLISKIEFTLTDWTSPENSVFTLTKELGLAKVLNIYKGNETSGYKAVEVDYIEISAGGTLTLSSPGAFDGFILVSGESSFDSSVAEEVDNIIDGKIRDKMATLITSGTEELEDGVSPLAAGTLYVMYE